MTTDERKLQLDSGEQKHYYVSPVAEWLVKTVGGGDMDMSQAKA